VETKGINGDIFSENGSSDEDRGGEGEDVFIT
jgi:hypothetical protein